MQIIGYEILDLRFPTSLTADGTDAVHKDPDYSAAYVILRTDTGDEGHGFTFTIGRGNDICTLELTRDAPSLITQGGFEIDKMETGYIARFPKSWTYFCWGTAIPQAH